MDPRLVLLYYSEPQGDRVLPGDRYLRRLLRPAVKLLTGTQKVSGFRMAYLLLVKALRQAGYRVEEGNRALALARPDQPVGLAGYPLVLDEWRLPNPALLGPGLYDHPKLRPDLFDDPRYRGFLTISPWMQTLFDRYYTGRCRLWYNGIDTREWPDVSGRPKDLDFLVYDKIRWNRDTLVPALLEPILDDLRRRGLSWELLRYGEYQHRHFRRLLSRTRGMLFLCEHETQGLAYQEAMASNVPVLAWDNGYWLDPHCKEWEADPVPTSSVPYFSEECGERFRGIEEYPAAVERFLERLGSFAPRRYVDRELSLAGSAELYMRHYVWAAGAG